MSILGVIVEYNPMHNGHIYHIEQAKKLTNADYTIAIMSGSFTQQGNIGIFNKFDRAKLAIENGIDLVIELPTIYAISSSENFGYGAVNILNSLGIVTHLAFGAECENISTLESIVSKLDNNDKKILDKTKEYMKSGISSVSANNKALKHLLSEEEYFQVSKPNNLLGVSYIRALNKLGSNIKPVLIKRIDSNHSDVETDNSSIYASSTSIRNLFAKYALTNNFYKEIKNIVPSNTYSLFKEEKAKLTDAIWPYLKYEILKLGKNGIKNIYEVSEGLENRIYNCGLSAKDYNEFIENVKSKRYTLGRIKRIVIYILIGITKEKYNEINGVKYARILKVNKSKKDLIRMINKASNISTITHISDKKVETLPKLILDSLKLDILATNIAESLEGEVNLDYTNML